MNRILYISDLDGTLLNSQSQISEQSIKIINQLIDKGVYFTYATARSLSSASVVTKGLNISVPVIIYNGAFIIHPQTHQIISSCYFEINERNDIHSLFHDCSLYPLVYTHQHDIERVLYMNKDLHVGTRKYLQSRKNDKRMTCVDNESELYQGNIFYYTCIGDYDDLKGVYDIVRNDQRFICTFQQELYSQEYWLEIMPKNATKANAIIKLKEILDCDKTICFGDAVNDIPMFKCCDEAYAMQNAVDDLKEIATDIIGDNDHNAVALFIKSIIK